MDGREADTLGVGFELDHGHGRGRRPGQLHGPLCVVELVLARGRVRRRGRENPPWFTERRNPDLPVVDLEPPLAKHDLDVTHDALGSPASVGHDIHARDFSLVAEMDRRCLDIRDPTELFLELVESALVDAHGVPHVRIGATSQQQLAGGKFGVGVTASLSQLRARANASCARDQRCASRGGRGAERRGDRVRTPPW